MTNKPTDAQIQELWEWCGLHIEEQIWKEDHFEPDGRWYDSEGLLYRGDFQYGIPSIDLNNLFKYAVPKLEKEGRMPHLHPYGMPNRYWVGFDARCELQEFTAPITPEKYALALFWAIWEVIK